MYSAQCTLYSIQCVYRLYNVQSECVHCEFTCMLDSSNAAFYTRAVCLCTDTIHCELNGYRKCHLTRYPGTRLPYLDTRLPYPGTGVPYLGTRLPYPDLGIPYLGTGIPCPVTRFLYPGIQVYI